MDGDTYKLKADFSEVDEAVKSAIDAFMDLQGHGVDAFEEIDEEVKKTSSSLAKAANKIGSALGADVFAPIKSAWASWTESSRARLSAVQDAVSAFGKKFQDFFPTFTSAAASSFGGFQSIAATTFGNVSESAKAMWASITGGATLVTDFLSGAFSAVLSPIKTVFSGIWGAAKSAAGYISSAFKGAIGFVKGMFSDLYGVVQGLLPLVGVGLGAGLAEGFKALREDEDALKRVSAAVKSTGGVAGFTADQLESMADALSKNSRFGGDAAMQAQAVALQFKNVRGDIFAQSLQVGADAAVAWGTSLESATEKVTRALDDPLEGFRLLKSEGTKFSAEEKEMIERMVEFGDVAGAQRIILSKLAAEVGGAAAEDLNSFSGMLHQVNEAMSDAWKAIAQALLPAVKQIVQWFKTGADTMASWAPVLGALTNDFITWANKSSGTFAEWGTKAQEIFLKTFDFVVDAATRAFSFVQTAIQDFPGFMQAAKAKMELYWEQIKQSVVSTWDSLTIEIEHLWEKAMAKMQNAYQAWGNKLASSTIFTKIFSKLYGIEEKDYLETLNEMKQEQQKVAGPKREMRGPSEDEVNRLKMLQEAADEAGGAFGEKFKENYDKNKETVDAFLQRVKDLTGLDLTPQDLKPKQSGEGFTLNKEAKEQDGGKAGGFEDLLSLQKRIQGATSSQAPEAKAMISLPNILKEQHREKKAAKEKEIAERKQQAAETNKKLQEVIDAGGLA